MTSQFPACASRSKNYDRKIPNLSLFPAKKTTENTEQKALQPGQLQLSSEQLNQIQCGVIQKVSVQSYKKLPQVSQMKIRDGKK